MQTTEKLSNHQLQLMTKNLQLLQHQITEQDEEQLHDSSSRLRSNNNVFHQMQTVVGQVKLRQIYLMYLESTNLPTNHQEKIEHLLQQKISMGSAMAVFQMVYYFKEALQETLLQQISRKAFSAIVNNIVSKEQLVIYSQLIAQCGKQDEQICQYYAEAILQNTHNFDTALFVLTNQGTTGLIYLIDIASRHIQNLTHKILDYLSRTQTIILSVIIPALLKAVTDTSLSRNRDLCLAALNRIAPLLTSQQVKQLVLLINDGSIDKKLLIGTVRCGGVAGEEMLLNLINSKKLNENTNAIALSVLSWRIPTKSVLRIKSIEYTLQHSFLPGRFFQYQGSLQPCDYTQEHCPDTLCLSARDFLAHLHHFFTEQSLLHYKQMNNKFLSQVVQALQLDDEQPLQTSQQVVQTLIHQLKNKSHTIRQIALLQIGNIGQPIATSASHAVSKCLSDSESTIRSAACWTIARICSSPSKKIEQKLTELLRDHFWKVRTSCCIALGLLLKQPLLNTVQSLVRCLQDGSIPKPTVCETLARMGAEQLLLQIFRVSARNDFKLREAIISSFAFISTQSTIFSSIIEEILRYSRDSRIQTRQLCLLTLSALRKQVEKSNNETLIYFNSKHLLPFYYCFLDDPSSKIRSIAAQSLLSFGPQAELIFIQGMTKGQPLAKIECIRCLGKLGPQNFRAVALGLRDEDSRVRAVTSQILVNCFRSEQVVDQFCRRQSQSTSLICNLKEMLYSPNLQHQLQQLLNSILQGLQGSSKERNFVRTNENICWN